MRVDVGVEAQAGEECKGGEGELAEDGGGEGDGFAAEAETGFDDLLPGVDVVLVLAGEELAHLEVDAVDVGGEGEDREEKEEGDGVGVGGGHLLPRLCFSATRCCRDDTSFLVGWDDSLFDDFLGDGRGCRLDEGGGEAEFAAEGGFAGGHFAVVGLVVFAGEVEEAVEEKDFISSGRVWP